MPTKKTEGSARDRLLAAANELFYEEGIHTVGIDRVIERAGVAKASLYSTFGSKEGLVQAYLAARGARRRARIEARMATHDAPREQLLAVFDDLVEVTADPTHRGCAYINAATGGPRDGNTVRATCAGSRTWLKERLEALAHAMGAREPERLARQLVILYDGVAAGAVMAHDPQKGTDARAIAEVLVDASVR